MTPDSETCVANNIDLYEAVLRPHGAVGAVKSDVWICPDRVPPYYSNAITVSRRDLATQRVVIAELADRAGKVISVKDSFATLDLAPIGFRQLFSAQWIWRPPEDVARSSWLRVTTPDHLSDWEAAWRAHGSPADQRIFLDPLLENPHLCFFASLAGDRVVAGCLANRSEESTGLSNFFTSAKDPESDYGAAAAAVGAFAPGRPVVGYERGDVLAVSGRHGFRQTGPLRVWLRDGD
ncbi:hypothetical protein [Bauldia sp.]|uniref:hypothetical protein n=1 Tax=Bauldia sp. TaxID=2575872 RepID=UPI003BAC43B7